MYSQVLLIRFSTCWILWLPSITFRHDLPLVLVNLTAVTFSRLQPVRLQTLPGRPEKGPGNFAWKIDPCRFGTGTHVYLRPQKVADVGNRPHGCEPKVLERSPGAKVQCRIQPSNIHISRWSSLREPETERSMTERDRWKFRPALS